MEIHLHAAEGDHAALIADLDSGIPVDVRDDQGRTPLMVAAASPNADVATLRLLLARGADVNALTLPKEPPKLDEATRKTLEEGPGGISWSDIEESAASRDSVLGYAIQKGAAADKLRLLVEADADAGYVNADGYSALTYAVYRSGGEPADQWSNFISLLIDAGAPLDAESRYAESALSVASISARFSLVALLLERGANPAPLGWTPLFHEIAADNMQGVIRLLNDGVPLEARDTFSRTPFLLAIHAGHREIAELLLDRGSNLAATGRCGHGALMYAISRDDAGMLQWLISVGCDPEVSSDFGIFPLLEAARSGATNCVKALLDAGASAGRHIEHGATPISDAASPEIVELLVAAGEELSDIGSDMRVELLKLRPGADRVAESEYHRHKHRAFGRQNPERMNNALWDWLVAKRISAYECASRHGDPRSDDEPVWCFNRFGQSITRLPDGRYVEIGGEHEDYYDQDFCIYNDLVVHDNGKFELYGYPEDVFPTTDFHSATLAWPHIYIIGSLGYSHERRPGETPVYRVDCHSWSIERIQCQGDAPGWIHGHKARLIENRQISIRGGLIDNGTGKLIPNTSHYVLELSNFTWAKQKPDD
jgi:ankyrin repeat protein